MTAPDDTQEGEAPAPAVRRRTFRQAAVAVCLGALVLLGLVWAGARYGVLLPQARLLIEARTDGLKIGRFGRLKIEGLAGDVWRDLTIRRLTVRDEKGVWLEADNVHMTWRYGDLFRRRFHADRIDAQLVRVIRRPTLTPKTKDNGLPVSFIIDEAHGRIEMLPAFSYQRGVYDLTMRLDIQRRGGREGVVKAVSVLHPGDHLDVTFDVAKARPLVILADAEEKQGGALAGAVGLPATEPFSLKVAAGGRMSEGRFTALARSGASEPLDARGAWTREGGQASGRVMIGASALLSAWSRRFGPMVEFDITGRKSGPDLFALQLRARAENLAVDAAGLGDLGERQVGPQGVRATVATPSLTKIIGGGPTLGPTSVTGVLTGGKASWRFAGDGMVRDSELFGYRLNQAQGAVEATLKGGVIALRAPALTSAGGHGADWMWALLGAAPKGSFELDRLRDGRLWLKEVHVRGPGLTLDGDGGKPLFGSGLTFKGKALASNFAVAHFGAQGQVQASWNAAQSAADRPWIFTVGAQGQKFALGVAELDRLLGTKPKLDLHMAYKDLVFTFDRARLDGASLDAAVTGAVPINGGMTMAGDWSATGPFRAGPLEINGKVRGPLKLSGPFVSPRADLTTDVASLDAPGLPLTNGHIVLSFLLQPGAAAGSSGSVAVAAQSAYGPARGRADFRFPKGGVDLTNVDVDAGGLKATGALSLRLDTPSSADLEVAVTRGAFLDAGRIGGHVRIVDQAGGPHAVLNLAGENARLPGSPVSIQLLRFAADGPLARLPYSAHALGGSAAGPWMFDGRGILAPTRPGYQLSFEGAGRLGDRNLRTVQPAVFRFGGTERSARVRLAASDGGGVNLDGRLTAAGADIAAQVSGLDLRLLNPDLAGRTDAVLSMQGRGRRLDGTLTAKLIGARGRGAPAASGINGVVEARLTDSVLTLNTTAADGQGLRANASFVLPTEASAAPFRIAIMRRRPIQGRFSAEGEVRPLWDLLVGGERSLSGHVRTAGTLGGTLADPTALGQIEVDNGRFDDGATGLSLRQVVLRAAFDRDQINVTQARGVDGRGGQVNGLGRISLERDGASSFRLFLHGFRLIDNEQATASATGEATIARDAAGKVRLSGDLAIDRADVAAKLPTPSGVVPMDVVERNRPSVLPATLPPPARRGVGWALDVRLHAPERIFLRGRGLDVELSLDAHVGGTTDNPDLTGTARVVRGEYDFAGRRFEFDPESVVYLSTRPNNLRLDLTATREDPSLTAVIRIRGTAARPEITFTSTPTLPNDEVLAQVLFGRSASQLSPLEAAQLASALSSLSRGGGFDVIGNLRTFAGLDRLALGGGDSSGVTVSGGKYLTDDVYLEITGGGREGSAAQVEWRVRRNLSILSRIGGQGAARLSVRWRRDY